MSNEYISVAVRLRPVLSFENPQNVTWDLRSFSTLLSLKSRKTFEFDKVYGMNATNQRIFDEICENRVWRAMEGFNFTVLCSGQTGSGKTYTMFGKKKEPGLVALSVQTIFSYIEETPNKEFLMRCSYCEVYNECINDLLNPLNINLPLRDDKHKGSVIVGLTEEICRTPEQILSLIKIGDSNKQVSSNCYNKKSSRSHCVFKIIIESRAKNSSSVDFGVINLFDLAGSEIEKQSGWNQESKYINKSIFTLSNVILKLSEDISNSHIPLRDSKLTRILGPSLLGQAKVVIISTLNPVLEHYEESLNTLALAQKAREILQTLTKNQGTGEISYLSKYKSDMEQLKEKLEGISRINSVKSNASEEDEQEKASIEIQLENLQTAILVSEKIREKTQNDLDEDLFDFSERRSLRLKYWRESNSTIRNSSVGEVEEEDSLANFSSARMSDFRMSIPEEPCVGNLSPFECKQHLEMFQLDERGSLNIGNELLKKEGIPLPHPDWLQLILDQESLITELQAQLALKTEENKSLKEEVRFCKQKLIDLRAKLLS